jgi:Phage integrase family
VQSKWASVPKFRRFIVSEQGNERRGFVEEPQYRKLAELAAGQLWLRGLLALAYTYGFRQAELLEMRCGQVDLLNDTIILYSGETKKGEGRTVALTRECRELVEWRNWQTRTTYDPAPDPSQACSPNLYSAFHTVSLQPSCANSRPCLPNRRLNIGCNDGKLMFREHTGCNIRSRLSRAHVRRSDACSSTSLESSWWTSTIH